MRLSRLLLTFLLAFALLLPAGACSPKRTADSQVKALLKSHDLATSGEVLRFDAAVPASWDVKLGEYPVGMFWAMANELSKDAGYDLTALKGKTVSVWKARLTGGLRGRDPSVSFQYPTDVIVLLDGNQVVGGWLSWNTGTVGPSLNKRWLEDITGGTLEQWAQRQGFFLDAGDNGDLAAMKPEQVLSAFFTAITDGKKTRAYACMAPRAMFEMLMVNKKPDCLYNPTPDENNSMVENILGGRVTSTSYYEVGQGATTLTDINGRTRIGVTVRLEGLKWRMEMFNSPDGRETRFAGMYNDGHGWKLEGLGTGP